MRWLSAVFIRAINFIARFLCGDEEIVVSIRNVPTAETRRQDESSIVNNCMTAHEYNSHSCSFALDWYSNKVWAWPLSSISYNRRGGPSTWIAHRGREARLYCNSGKNHNQISRTGPLTSGSISHYFIDRYRVRT